MLPFWYLVGTLGDLLEVVLLCRVWRDRLWRHYPFFCVFLVYLLSNTLIQTVLLKWYGLRSHSYATFYWATDIVGIGLWAFVAWEIFRHSFPRGSGPRAVAGGVSLLLAAAMTGLLVLTHGNPIFPRSIWHLALNFGRYASLVLAPVVLWLLVATRYYHIPLGRNIWGMAVGFGLFLSLGAVNCAAYLLGHSQWALSSLTTPTAFAMQLLVWTWALWDYAPNPKFAAASAESTASDFILWRQEWGRLLASMRKAFER